MSFANTPTQSSKTPSGISKKLLTPCRRMGLTRSKKTPSPSPLLLQISTKQVQDSPVTTIPGKKSSQRLLSTNIQTIKNEEHESRDEPKCQEIFESGTNKVEILPEDSIDDNIEVLASDKNACRENISQQISQQEEQKSCKITKKLDEINPSTITQETKENYDVNDQILENNPLKEKGKKKLVVCETTESKKRVIKRKNPKENVKKSINPKIGSPKLSSKSEMSLAKQCIVVIENKVLHDSTKQAIHIESESDDETLINIIEKKTKQTEVKNKKRQQSPHHEMPDKKVKCLAVESENTQKSSDCKADQGKSVTPSPASQSSSQKSLEIDDENDFECHKTILIKKLYNKTTLPLKSKSTGSITQKDIDDIKMRIKMKQSALLAKSKGHNIVELQTLIKKWRKGCQEALMHLLELMKRKFPDKEQMELPELLKMLNITPDLVSYDVLEDCFN